MLRKVPWDSLDAFAEFADSGNFTHAAARLHLSQPALHTKIANLTRTLGVTLYVRRGRAIEITEAGRKVQRFAHELREAAKQFDSELHGAAQSQTVVLTAGEGSYLYILGDGIRAYRSSTNHPLSLQTADAQSAIASVTSGKAHLGVASVETSPEGLAIQTLTKVGQVGAMPVRHPLANKRSLRLKDMAGASLIVPPAGRPHRTMISRMLQSEGVDWNVAVEVSGWELMLQFVQLGLGLAIVNACCRLPKGVVTRPMPELPSIHYSIFHLNRKLSPPVKALKDALIANANAWKAD